MSRRERWTINLGCVLMIVVAAIDILSSSVVH